MVENVQREDCKPLHDEDERGKEGKRRQREKRTSQSETSLGEVWKRALSPFALGGRIGNVSTLQRKDCREGRR